MDILSTLLSGQSMTLLAAAISLGIVIRNLTGIAGQVTDLHTRLDKAQLVGIPTIKEMSEDLSPRKQLVQKLQDYYNVRLEIVHKTAMAEQEKKDAAKIHMHHPSGLH